MKPKKKVPASDYKQIRGTIIQLTRQGHSELDIHHITGYNRNTIKKWSSRESPEDESRPGRPRKITAFVAKMIEGQMKEKPGVGVRTCAKSLNAWFEATGQNRSISPSGIQKYLKTTDWGHTSFKLRQKPLLSERNITDRLKFIKYCEESGYTDSGRRGIELRNSILWTDESWIELNPKMNRQNMRFRTTHRENVPVNMVPKYGVKIMVAGGICSTGKTTLILIPPNVTITAKTYQEMILPVYLHFLQDTNMFPKPRKSTFMQDGAPAHTAKTTLQIIKSLESESGLKVWSKGIWPGNSPDFNPIEHIWDLLQNSVFEIPRPTNSQELWIRVLNKWENLSEEYLTKLAQSLPKRLAESKANAGRHSSF